jgi:amphi-Trp domain-containing protein
MVEFEWKKKGQRAEAAALLRELADSLAASGEVELEHDGWELKVELGDQVEIGVEVEVEGGEVELEISLTSARKPARKPARRATRRPARRAAAGGGDG